MSSKSVKIFVFLFLILSFLLITLYSLFGFSISFLSEKSIKTNRKLKTDLIDNIKINNMDTIYDKNDNIYYYNVPDRYENNIYVLKLELENGYKYKLKGKNLNIIKVKYDIPIDVIIYNDNYYYETKIQITNLPLISIETEDKITNKDTESTFKYLNANNSNKKVVSNIKIHVRGATSQHLLKKPYKVKMYDSNYKEEKKLLISDFYYGSSFILDAVYRDQSKIRNVLSTQLWNDISNDFTDVNINSEFIELFINNEYQGLYVLTEPINRRKLNLNKSSNLNSGVIIKTNGWKTIGTKKDFKNINDVSYLDYEIKYPDDETLFYRIWENYLNLISDYFNPDVVTTDKVISDTFNLKNYIDIIIFNSFTGNVDSCLLRNTYYYMLDISAEEVYIQPWDMEFSYGYYLSESIFSSFEADKITCEFKQASAPKTNKMLISRYWELRKNILTEEYFDNLLDEYKNELTKGAALRDSKLWYEYDIEKEIDKIRTWIHNRIQFFDKYVRGLENE